MASRKALSPKWDWLTMQVPTLPTYDWGVVPEGQPEYVNPVVLNNKVIVWTNMLLTVAERQSDLYRELADARAAFQDAKDALTDFEQLLLKDHPPAVASSKTLKLLDAYILRTAAETNQEPKLRELVVAVRAAQKLVGSVEVRIDNSKAVWQSLKLAGEQAMVHLSFVKSEDRYARGRQT